MLAGKIDTSKIIIVSFEPGGGGHTIGRVLCCLPDVYWYSHPNNGKHPWNVHFTHTDIRQRYAARNHYDRYTHKGILPPPHDYVVDWIPDADDYYANYFLPRWQEAGGNEILETKRIVLMSHSLPEDLIKYFPESKILSIVDKPEITAEKYLVTTALFPAYLKLAWIDGENRPYGKRLKAIADLIGRDMTHRDLWAYERYGVKYKNTHQDEYRAWTHDFMQANMLKRHAFSHKNVLTTRRKDYKLIKKFLKEIS